MKDDGGRAFPRPAGWNGLTNFEEHSSNEPEDGMSLRDYFAAKALQAMLGNQAALEALHEVVPTEKSDDALANRAYFFADAMLKARNG